MAYDKIIILQRSGQPSDVNYDVLFRISISKDRHKYYADPSKVTQYPDESDEQANLDLQAGVILEFRETLHFPDKIADSTIQDTAVKRYSEILKLTATTNVFDRFGSAWDGNAWTMKGIA